MSSSTSGSVPTLRTNCSSAGDTSSRMLASRRTVTGASELLEAVVVHQRIRRLGRALDADAAGLEALEVLDRLRLALDDRVELLAAPTRREAVHRERQVMRVERLVGRRVRFGELKRVALQLAPGVIERRL